MFTYNLFVCLASVGGAATLLESSMSLVSDASELSLTHLAEVPSVVAIASLPKTMRHILVGGETLTAEVIVGLPARISLNNGYGPTELTCCATWKCVNRSDAPGRLASIGKPLPNVTCYVVDPASTTTAATSAPLLQPIGVWGELWLGGVQVARGYLNRPELTAERFVPNPWAETDPSGRGVVYRTGDRVRWYADRYGWMGR